jgi:hypothetical protein
VLLVEKLSERSFKFGISRMAFLEGVLHRTTAVCCPANHSPRTRDMFTADGRSETLSSEADGLGGVGWGAGRPAVDDYSACRGLCGHRGMCRKNKCQCTAAYVGMRCQEPRPMPLALHAEFEGNPLLKSRKGA